MSFILEALRKSEAERRRGQAPDLLSDAVPVAPVMRTRVDHHVRMLAALAAALIALLLVAWMLRTSAPAESSAAIAATPSTPATIATAVTPPFASPASLSPPPPTRTAPKRLAPMPPATRSSEVAAQAAAPSATLTPSAAPQTQAHAQPHVFDMAAVAPSPVATNAPAPAATFASPDAPLRLADLPTEEREQLPTLKLSMHMWAADPANRFAIIDGSRVNEGDRVGDATVEAIQQDGVMLSWHGRRIRLPIR